MEGLEAHFAGRGKAGGADKHSNFHPGLVDP
jgi:hypothetical protein